MPEQARAFWVIEPGRGEIHDQPLPTAAAADVVVRTLFSGISRGTEALVFNGRVPPRERDRMRAPFQEGTFPGPVKYGYSNVGIVEQGPVSLVGRHVFVLYPHQTRYVVPLDAVHPIPDDVPPERAVLAANLETAINGIWDARPHVGDRVAVVGGGTVGCLAAWLAAGIRGCDVELVDVNPARASIADALGVRFAAPEAATEADVILHASGTPSGLEVALRIAAFECAIVDISWYGDQPVPLPLGEAFHSQRLTLKSSQVGTIAPSQRSRWNSRRRLQLALSLLRDPVLDALISGECAFQDLPATILRLATNPDGALCWRVRY
jgi:2-desacetyl-2-hydroxyethyl bacteriochlorophyllide A dehydrogenase